MNRYLISTALGGIRDEYITAAACSPADIQSVRRIPTKKMLMIVAAAVLLLAFSVTAYASGWLTSIFSRVGEQFGIPTPSRYDEAGELSNKTPERISLRDLPGIVFTLSESYYDGEDLLLAYSLETTTYSVQFGFGPGHEGFDSLRWLGEFDPAVLRDAVSANDYERITDFYLTVETGGFIVRTSFLGDHIRLPDGTDLGPILNNYTIDGTRILECQNALPESARGKDELTLVFTVREALVYFYKDGSTLYQYSDPLREENVTVVIPSTGGNGAAK